MVNSRIIYPTDEGGVAIVIPSPEYTGTMEELAEATVPPGTEFKVVLVSDIPTDRTFRNAWEYQS